MPSLFERLIDISPLSRSFSRRMKKLILSFVTLAIASAPIEGVSAAELTVESYDDGNLTIILISGEIEQGDELKFRKLALEHSNALVVLESPGGAVGPALEIGRAISISGFPTAVLGDSYCTSACALIWMAGSVRALSNEARLGFHASYRDENGVALESGAANALIGQYLTQLGLPSKAILFATLAPPSDFLWLDESTRGASGITYRLIENGGSPETRSEENRVSAAPIPPSSAPKSEFEERIGKFPKEWVARKASKYGLDVTSDGRMWFNSDTYGDTVDYGVSADDLWTVSGRYRQAWVRGYHKRDPSVPYRESLQLIHADCLQKRWGSEMVIHYDADGKMIHQDGGAWNWEPVVPRTYAETWHEAICAD